MEGDLIKFLFEYIIIIFMFCSSSVVSAGISRILSRVSWLVSLIRVRLDDSPRFESPSTAMGGLFLGDVALYGVDSIAKLESCSSR